MYFSETQVPKTYHLIDNPKKISWLFGELLKAPEFSFDIETNHPTWKGKKKLPDAFEECICGISFAWGRTQVTEPWIPGIAAYLPLTDAYDRPYWPHQEAVLNALREVLESPVPKVAQNGKFDIFQLAMLNDIFVENFAFDTMLAHALIDEDRVVCSHALKSDFGLKGQILKLGMADAYLRAEASLFKSDLTEALAFYDQHLKRYSKVPLDKLYPYGCADADLTLSLKFVFEPKVEEEGMLPLFRELIMPLSHVLTVMELHGVPLDIQRAQQVHREQAAIMKRAQDQIRKMLEKNDPAAVHQQPMGASRTKSNINVGSPHQLGEALFRPKAEGGLGLPGRKSKDGKWVTDADTIKALEHPIKDHILEYRRAEQIHGHYAEAALDKIVERTNGGTIGWVHPHYWMDSVTGRLKLTEPNLTTLPRPENGGIIVKSMWCADEDHILVFSDFSQIELRVIAHVSQEPVWIEGFLAGHDMHSAMAHRIWNLDCPIGEVKKKYPKQRSDAKAVNFGIAYGESEFSLAERLGISIEEAHKLIHEDYFGAAPVLKQWIDDTHQNLREYGVSRNIFGRVRHLPDAQLVIPESATWPSRDSRPVCYRNGPHPSSVGLTFEEAFEIIYGPYGAVARCSLSESHLKDLVQTRRSSDIRPSCPDCEHLYSCFVNREVKYISGKVGRALRQGVNQPIQGSAVDMTSLSLIGIYNDFRRYEVAACPILHIHDELVVYSHKSAVEQVKKIMYDNMVTKMKARTNFSIPILIDTEVVQRWSDKYKEEE